MGKPDRKVIYPISNPRSPTGGLAILKGNLAPEGAGVKLAHVEHLNHVLRGRARVFNREEDAFSAVRSQEILPGDVNWMTAGRGIVHSERETHETKASNHALNGLQCWVALPEKFAEIDPAFSHHKKCQLPQFNKEGVFARLIAGDALGMTSPIRTFSPMFFLDVIFSADSSFERPNPDQECALYVIEGEILVDSECYKTGDFILLSAEASVSSKAFARAVFLGGEHWPQHPHMYWNFVSFSKERIEQAKRDWQEQRFPDIPGDNHEFTPLP